MKPLRFIGLFVLLSILVLVIGPLVIPVPPLQDPLPIEQVADPDSQFINVNGIEVHFKQYGQGEPAIILLHGFGASTFSWREVLQPLAGIGTVIAYDRPAFGLTERPLPGDWEGESPYSLNSQVKLLFGLMEALGINQAVLVGNSAGGTVAMQAALTDPQKVAGLVLVDAAIYTSGGAPSWIRPFLSTPWFNRWGPYFTRSIAGEQGDQFIRAAWHDPGKITDEIIAGYRKPLQLANWDAALWEHTKAATPANLEEALTEIRVPVLVVSGDDDRIVPTADSVRLAGDIPGAGLIVFPSCGHVPQEECPTDFLNAVVPFIQQPKN